MGRVVGEPAPAAGLDPDRLLERIGAAERLADAVHAVQVHDLAGFAAARRAEDHELGLRGDLVGRTAAIEVAAACTVATQTAQSRLCDAEVATGRLPGLLGLVGGGRVSMGGLRRVIAETWLLDPNLFAAADRLLAAEATSRRLSPGQLGTAAARRVMQLDPDAAAKRAASARWDRRVRLCDPVDGTAAVVATLRAEDALAVWDRLDRTARGLRAHGDARSLDRLRADLYVELITGRPMLSGPTPDDDAAAGAATGTVDSADNAAGAAGDEAAGDEAGGAVWRSVAGREPWTWTSPPPPVELQSDPDPEPGHRCWDTYPDTDTDTDTDADQPGDGPVLARTVEVQVVVSLSSLLGLDDDPGLLRGYGAVPAGLIRDLIDHNEAAGGSTVLRGLFCDPIDGRLIAMDSTARFFTGGLRQFLACRDQTDRLTGGTIADLDHICDHDHGGATTAANGQGLGRRSHTLKDHPGISVHTLPVDQHGDGLDTYRQHAPDIRWTLPTGHTLRSRPPPALGHGSDPAAMPDQAAIIALADRGYTDTELPHILRTLRHSTAA